MNNLVPGLVSETTQLVTKEESASELGSGTLEVFGTPAMALLVEQLCLEMVEGFLEEGQTTVGVDIKVQHLAPTPIGDSVHVKAEILEVDNVLIHFKATIWDSSELVGEVEHTRAIIDIERFQRRVDKKKTNLALDSKS